MLPEGSHLHQEDSTLFILNRVKVLAAVSYRFNLGSDQTRLTITEAIYQYYSCRFSFKYLGY